MELAQYILLRMKQLKEVRKDYETGLWEDITRFVNPRREHINQNDLWEKKGQRRGKDVYDGTPLGALNVWVDGMQGFLVSESFPWFRSEMDESFLNDIDEVLGWLQEYDKAMYSAFRRSNFYSVLPEWFRDAGSIGTATIYVEENIAEKRAVLTVIHPGEIFIAENAFGEVDTVYRNFLLTARDAVQKFGYNGGLSERIKESARNNPEKEHEFIHAVFPNDDLIPDNIPRGKKKFRSVYQEATNNNNVVRDSGYDMNPYAVWRFRKSSDEPYGYSPAADAIVEVFSLNQFGKTLMQAAQKSVEPPLNVPSEMRGNVRMTPSGYNYYDDANRVISAVQERINYPVSIDQLERLQKSIEDKYRVEFFLILARATREMTATEIMERQSEKAVLMGPQVDRLYNEGLKKIFDIVSYIEDRAGRLDALPPVPPAIVDSGGRININLIGPLAQAQKRLFRMQPIRAGVNELAPMFTVFPEMRYKIKAMETADEILESANFPESLTRSNDEALDLYNADMLAAAQQKMIETAGGAAEGYKKIVKKPEEGSPAEAIMKAVKGT